MKKKKEGKVVLGGMEGVKLRLLRAREKEKKQEEELSRREHPTREKIKKGLERLSKRISKGLSKKIVSRRVFKPSQVTLVIKKQEPHSILRDPNRFFKDTLDETRRDLFFS